MKRPNSGWAGAPRPPPSISSVAASRSITLEAPEAAFAEMVRVCRPGGRIVLYDAVPSDDPAKAAAFNRMERHRDPSTVEFVRWLRTWGCSATLGCPSRGRVSTRCRRSATAWLPCPSPRARTAPARGR